MKRVVIKKSDYRDSLFLMRLSNEVSTWPKVKQAVIVMGTPNNKHILEQVGLLDKLCDTAKPEDLIIAVEFKENVNEDRFFLQVGQHLNKSKPSDMDWKY